MATLYEYLADSTRTKYPLESLDPKAAKFLSTAVPQSYSPGKLARIVALAERGIGKYARSGGSVAPPAADQAPSAAVSPSQTLARRPGVDYARLEAGLSRRLSPFNEGELPDESEPATHDIYRRQGPIAKFGMRLMEAVYPFGAGAVRGGIESAKGLASGPAAPGLAAAKLVQEVMGLPAEDEFQRELDRRIPSHEDIVPDAAGGWEHAADVAGSVLGFTAGVAAGRGVGLGPTASLALTGALPETGIRNRAIAAGTTAAAGAAGHAIGARLAPRGANLARQAGAGAVGAVAFGAGEPAARSLTQRLTGDPDYPAPTLEDLVRGTAELGVVNALGLMVPAARAGAGRLALQRMEAERAAREADFRRRGVVPPEVAAARASVPAGGPVENVDTGAPPIASRPPGEAPAAKVRNPVLEKLAPEFANDSRPVAAGRTVADVFAEMVQAEVGQATDRAAWKAAVRKVVASGRIKAVQDIAEAMAEPGDAARRGVTPELRAREARFTDEVNQRAAGRVMTLNIDGEPVRLRIARVAVFRYPGEARPVRVIVEDVTNGRLFPLRFRNVAELSQAANNPQALVKAEDVFARSERQRRVQAERQKEQAQAPAGAGGPEAAPAAAPTAAAPAAPSAPAAEAPPARKRATVAPPSAPSGKPAEVAPNVPPSQRAEYIRRYGEGLAAQHEKLRGQQRIKFKARLWEQARDKTADPADRLGAVEALRRIQAKERGEGGPGESPGTGPSAPPPSPAKPTGPAPGAAPAGAAEAPARKRVAIGMEFTDPKKAQAVADAMNKQNPDVEAAVAMRRGKPVVEVNEDAAAPKPEAKPAPKAEPAAAPAAPEKAAEAAAVESRPAGGSDAPPAAPAAKPEKAAPFAPGEKVITRDAMEVGKVVEVRGKKALVELEHGEQREIPLRNLQSMRPVKGPDKPAALAPNSAEDLVAMRDASRFKEGQRISVPNEGARHNDTRIRRKGYVVGWERGKDGEVRVRVKVPYGKSGWREFSTPEKWARALPSKAAREAGVKKRAAEGAKLGESIYEQVKGNPRAAREMVRKYEAMKEDALEKADYIKGEHGQEAAYRKLRESAVRAERARGVAEEVRQRVIKEVAGRDEVMHRDIVPFFEREKDFDAYVTPIRDAVEDFPQHFTLERQARYLHRAATMELPNAAEWKAEIDFERGMAERGVAPEHAAHATEATGRLRRFIEQAKDNPLFDEADIAPYRDMLKPERVDTPEALAKTLKEFDDAVPPGPADDIPAGVQPEPPEGFAERLNERGMARAELLAPWMWLKVLREIPRAYARARRNVERKARKFSIYDASGNALETRDHQLYEPDYYSESALTRMLAHVGLEPGAHVLTPELRTTYKASISEHARIRAEWRWHLVQKLGLDLANKVRAYSKTSKQLDRVLEGREPESSLPADIRPAVKAFKEWYAERWEIIKKQARDIGEPEPTSKLEGRYVGPRLIQGHISKTIERMFSDIVGEGRAAPEITEMKNRFLHERTGDPVYREDAMYRAEEYIDAMSRYLAHRRFFNEVKEFVETNKMTDRHRVGAVINLLKGTLLRQKGGFEKLMDRALAVVRYANAPPDIIEYGVEAAAKQLGVTVEQLKKGNGIKRVFTVPKGVRYRVGNDAKDFVLGTLEDGSTLVGTGGAHLFGELPKLWKFEEALQRKKLRAKVEGLAKLEAANKKATGEEGGYLSPHFTKDQHVEMMFEEWRDMVLSSRNDLTAAAFRGMGDRLTRAVLGNNLRAVLQNSMQPWLTLAPEIGYRRTLQSIIENALAGKRGKLTAEVTGSLQGELQRTEELLQQTSWFRKVNAAFGPMAGYKFAEDFTRGVGMMAGEIMARRMGLKAPVPMDFNGEINAKFFDDWRLKTEAMRQSGTTENLQQTFDTEAMYDYNMLGQSPIFGGAMGKLFGRLMTFPGRYFRRAVTRPLGGAMKVARAAVLGGVDRATGGALKAGGMPVGPAGKFRRGYKARGKYTGPTNAFDAFLDYYGARAHDRQGARVFLRQMQGMGMLAGLAAATGINAFIVGTPGWERIPLMAILSFLPPGSPLHKRVKDLIDTTQRSAVIDPERGVESTMSPLIRTGYSLVKEQTQAVGAAYRRAQEGDPLGSADALSKPLRKALGETGRQMFIPSLVAIRRLFQQAPFAEQFFKTDAGKAFANVMGIKTYIKGNGALGFIKGTLGLTPVTEEAKRRVRIDKPKPQGQRARRPRKARVASGSIYSSVLGMGGTQEAFA